MAETGDAMVHMPGATDWGLCSCAVIPEGADDLAVAIRVLGSSTLEVRAVFVDAHGPRACYWEVRSRRRPAYATRMRNGDRLDLRDARGRLAASLSTADSEPLPSRGVRHPDYEPLAARTHLEN